MCVAICMEPGSTLTEEEVGKMGRANADGVGLAWAEDGAVKWWKSTNYRDEYLTHVVNERVDFFRFVHFRLSTAGGVRADLCHPFEIGPLANPAPTGVSSRVLMHNGHWHRWTDVFDILKKEQLLPDTGPWSDTRLGALLASQDMDWIDTMGGKVAVLEGDGSIKRWGVWEELRAGIKVSNKTWDHNYNYKRSGKDRQWTGWGWSEENWKEKEAHEKEKEKAHGTEKEEKGSIRVGNESGHKQVRTVQDEKGAKASRRNFDHTPWQNPETKKWYWIDPSTSGRKGRVVEISAETAARIMESLTPSSDP